MNNLQYHSKEVAAICAVQWENFYSKFHLSQLAQAFEALVFTQTGESYQANPKPLK